ncbi:Hypothetical predicted protein [Paramuricea clavata]|uniref:Uncharacterized protein n=1 Tax=Paramuricea clavata TaxID=317549 RepID=A0A6S7ISH8_PARCT|nr:Hypothetical predicted protein [Paramuricea clavata]
MEWLCEATPKEIVMVGRKAETMGELKQLVEKHIQNRITRRNSYDPICSECGTTTTTRMRTVRKSLTISGFVGLRDICLSMLLTGIGIRYWSSLEASLDEDRLCGKVFVELGWKPEGAPTITIGRTVKVEPHRSPHYFNTSLVIDWAFLSNHPKSPQLIGKQKKIRNDKK